ncbi:2-C-methyl-D-erythritol 4-phosphate cytidylyltransferase [Thermosediminibacter oceani]|uniref:2-C-methyl-D-erythritol 4-phosphate cytidylyltransferase n=1 Tax=Thermosediminibacter oceani (strain ATCC BAA-1034 / DSM 16646 / JW/IW-1228P) TaxID=555079 RepID=D9S0H4_THEOJ|nr:2-C-methyl-D-erythritol 4-phosphate cytidylyltransferase [Thermosediminibacter oceani]ADL08832.1 2-C-methyl-D-erythritol 4-phosphate cytidylyltransferase [Thermosediminibacter oceani DSM 16646]
MKIAAVIAAGGRGRRMNSTLSKQFLMLKGRPILYYTLSTFESLEEIGEIILVVGPSDIFLAEQEVLIPYCFKKVKLVEGGRERQDSVYNGLRSCSPQTDIVVIHDGVRPFVTKTMIKNSIEAAVKYRAVGVGVPVKDTIKVVDKGLIINTPARSTLWAIQTPQTFEYNLILRAHEEARKSGFYGTDDTVLVERLGYPVRMIEGAYENIKITTPEDMIVAEAFMNMGYGDFKR